MRWMIRAAPPILIGLAVFLLSTAPASAHIPTYGTSTSNNWGSVYGHGPTVYVQLMNSLGGYTNMVTDYNNGRGHLNGQTDSGVAANPPFTDVIPGNSPTPNVFFVLAASGDEAVINAVIGFAACPSSSSNWATVYKMNDYGSGTHWHTLNQKICVWPGNFSRTATNSEGLRFQYLTFEHEMSHILNLDDATDSHSSLMQSGLMMHEMITGERDAITLHY